MSNTTPEPTSPYGPFGPVPPQQPVKKKHTLRNLLIIGGACLVGIVGCSAAVAGSGTPDTTTKVEAAAPAPVEPSTEAPVEGDTTPAPAPKPVPKTVDKKAAPAPKSKPAPAPKQSTEDKFVAIVQKGIDDGNEASDDLKMGRVMKKRDKAVCNLHASKVRNWTGTVHTLDSNGDGDGVLSIELSDDIRVGTWNNALSDIGDNTLIKSDKLMDRLAEMEEGQEVTFSGTFIKGENGGCTNVKGLTKIGKLLDPEYVFKFSDVKAA